MVALQQTRQLRRDPSAPKCVFKSRSRHQGRQPRRLSTQPDDAGCPGSSASRRLTMCCATDRDAAPGAPGRRRRGEALDRAGESSGHSVQAGTAADLLQRRCDALSPAAQGMQAVEAASAHRLLDQPVPVGGTHARQLDAGQAARHNATNPGGAPHQLCDASGRPDPPSSGAEPTSAWLATLSEPLELAVGRWQGASMLTPVGTATQLWSHRDGPAAPPNAQAVSRRNLSLPAACCAFRRASTLPCDHEPPDSLVWG